MDESQDARRRCEALVLPHQVSVVPSSIYAIIPTVVRSRMPKSVPTLGSVRQTLRQAVTREHSRTQSMPEVRAERETETEGHTRTAEGDASRSRSSSGSSTPLPTTPPNGMIFPPLPSPSLCPSPRSTPRGTETGGTSTPVQVDMYAGGVNWAVAEAGIRLWISARIQVEQDASRNSIHEANTNAAVARNMHMDALKYMHRALPPDMSESEIVTLRQSLPPQLQLRDPSFSTTQQDNLGFTQRPNRLRRGIAQTVCWIVALLLLAFPYIMLSLNFLMEYEKENRLLQRVALTGVEMTRHIGRQGLLWGDAMLQFKDRPIGAFCIDRTRWVMESIVGGINDGLAQSTSNQTGEGNRREQKSFSIES